MQIQTTRFDVVSIQPDNILLFPTGIPGLDECRHWILLADSENNALGWLQSISRPEFALAVVSPKRFVANYQVRITRAEMAALQLDDSQDAHVLAVVSRSEKALVLNLKAPVILNLTKRLGRQVVVNDDQPLQHEIAYQHAHLRKSA